MPRWMRLSSRSMPSTRTLSWRSKPAQAPPLVGVTMEAVLTLLKEKTDWASARKVLGDTGFAAEFDKDNISPKGSSAWRSLSPARFTPEIVQSQSQAAKSLCMWCHAMHLRGVEKVVRPKRRRLPRLRHRLQRHSRRSRKQQFLKDVQDKVAPTRGPRRAEAGPIPQGPGSARGSPGARRARERPRRRGCALINRRILGDQRGLLVGSVFVSAACISYMARSTAPTATSS